MVWRCVGLQRAKAGCFDVLDLIQWIQLEQMHSFVCPSVNTGDCYHGQFSLASDMMIAMAVADLAHLHWLKVSGPGRHADASYIHSCLTAASTAVRLGDCKHGHLSCVRCKSQSCDCGDVSHLCTQCAEKLQTLNNTLLPNT